ncbi:hypothetical protein [Amycolatopsis vastitatis]|uniref:Uncharacterized protein n=1 Tax=Amycolatopsis vastitatis TaxID=1905142 RepID=A0A229T0C4_9PSEU|nr:hypothetical protein [Amycolatopsis vastitatis]OXM64728.1 hypothetical protein CF165_26200 [Amycolatopsis vastitatis]
MDLTDRRTAVTKLFEAHRKAPFPSRWWGGDVGGIDMVMLDANPAGCVSVWLEQQGLLDDRRRNLLAEGEQRLIPVIPELDANHTWQRGIALRTDGTVLGGPR